MNKTGKTMQKIITAFVLLVACLSFGSMCAFAESLLSDGQALVIGDNTKEILLISDMIDSHTSNAIRWQGNYENAKIMAIDAITEIKTDDFVVLESNSYTPKVVLHTKNGLAIGVRSDNELLNTINVGDSIQLCGTITGFMKHGNGIGIINTNGNGTGFKIYDGDSPKEPRKYISAQEENLYLIITDFTSNNNYKDSVFWSDYYISEYADNAENTQEIKALKDKILENCYQGTYIKKYDIAVGTVSNISELDVSDGGEGYDYTDSNLASNIQLYGTYLKNQGYEDKGMAKGTVNGEEDVYAQFTNSDGVTFGLAQGADGNMMRILIYAPEAMLEKMKNESSESETSSSTIYTDSETVKRVQETLNAKGYDCGTPDGAKGPHTTSVIQQYQNDNGLEATGEIDDALLSSLGIQ